MSTMKPLFHKLGWFGAGCLVGAAAMILFGFLLVTLETRQASREATERNEQAALRLAEGAKKMEQLGKELEKLTDDDVPSEWCVEVKESQSDDGRYQIVEYTRGDLTLRMSTPQDEKFVSGTILYRGERIGAIIISNELGTMVVPSKKDNAKLTTTVSTDGTISVSLRGEDIDSVDSIVIKDKTMHLLGDLEYTKNRRAAEIYKPTFEEAFGEKK